MAYICGVVTAEEKVELIRRGWDIEPCPDEICTLGSDMPSGAESICIYVDTNVFDVMNGPDWDKDEYLPPERLKFKPTFRPKK